MTIAELVEILESQPDQQKLVHVSEAGKTYAEALATATKVDNPGRGIFVILGSIPVIGRVD